MRRGADRRRVAPFALALLLAAVATGALATSARAQVSGGTPSAQPRGSRFMRFPGNDAAPGSAAAPATAPGATPGGERVGATIEPSALATHPPIPATVDAALLRLRAWAAGRGPTGSIAVASGDPAWCDAGLCPLVDAIEDALGRGDGRAALSAIEKGRAILGRDVIEPCDRRAGEAALAQLECDARARAAGEHPPVFCVTRGDDPLASEARVAGCSDRLCADAARLASAAGTLRWAVCQANAVPASEPSPRIRFALEPLHCDDGAASYAPIELGGAPVTVLRASTVIDGYSQPGAMRGDLAARREPVGLPALTAAAGAVGDGRESVVPLLEISAPDVVVSGIAFDETPGRAAILVDRRGEAEPRCGAGGRDAWITGNVFRGMGHTAVFVGGPAEAFGREPEITEVGGVVIGARSDRPDPASLNVFRGEEPSAVLVTRARDVFGRKGLPRVTDVQVRGNWFAEPSTSQTLGVFLNDTDDAVVECNLLGAVHAGVAVFGGRGTKIRRNLFEGTASPVKIAGGAARVTVGGGAAEKRAKKDDPLARLCPVPGPGNRLEAPDEGIELDGRVDDVEVAGNEVVGGFEAAISVHPSATGDGARRARIAGNRIEDSVAGIRVSGGDVTVIGNLVRGSRGYGMEVSGTVLAVLTPPLEARVRVGSAERPNTFERNGAGGILLVDTDLVNESAVGRENRFVANEGPHVMAAFRGLLRLIDGHEAPLVGARITIDADRWLGRAIEATSDEQGFAGLAQIDPDDPLTWPLIPSWAEVEPTDLPPDVPPGGTEATSTVSEAAAGSTAGKPAPPPPPTSKRLDWTPGRVRLELADRVVTLPLSWDAYRTIPDMEGVTVEDRCVGGDGATCAGGMRLLRKVVVDTARISSSYPAP